MGLLGLLVRSGFDLDDEEGNVVAPFVDREEFVDRVSVKVSPSTSGATIPYGSVRAHDQPADR